MGRLLKLLHSDGAAGSPPPAYPDLQPLIASAVWDCDATSALSYPGSGQTLANLVAAPADGSAQTAYDFWLGADNTASASDPTFTGSAGSSTAEFSLDGGDFFTIKANTALIDNMHKTTGGASWSMAFVGNFKKRTIASVGAALFGTNALDGAKHGITFGNGAFGSTNKATVIASGGFSTLYADAGANDIFDDAYKFVALTFNPSTGDLKIYLGNAAVITGNVGFWISTSAASHLLQLCAAGNSASPMYSGTKFIAASMFNSILSDADVVTLRSMYSTRHNRTY